MGIGVKSHERRWPNLTIPYKIDSSFNLETANMAINEWNNSRMVVKFVEHTSDAVAEFVTFKEKEKGKDDHGRCNAVKGYYENSDQYITCFTDISYDKNTILHEMAHIAGLAHEHRRPDSGNYIERTSEARVHYLPYSSKEMFHFSIYTCYDYKSITHYQSGDEISGAKYDTKSSHPELFGGYRYFDHNATLGFNNKIRRDGLSVNDIYTIWLMYRMDCPIPPVECRYVESPNRVIMIP